MQDILEHPVDRYSIRLELIEPVILQYECCRCVLTKSEEICGLIERILNRQILADFSLRCGMLMLTLRWNEVRIST